MSEILSSNSACKEAMKEVVDLSCSYIDFYKVEI